MNAVLQIKPREMRMMSERIFSLGQMPKGFALTLTDLPMYSQMQGLGGFALMEQRQADFLHADPRALRVAAEAGPDVTFDAAGQHAWVALPSVLDLLGEGCARFGRACVTVIDVKDRKELELAAGLGLRLGLKIGVDDLALTAIPCAPADPVLDRALHAGTPIDADLWWRIYALARTALAPDTPASRRHAGVIIVTEDGTVIGRKDNDDDSDVSLLIRDRIDAEGPKA